MGTVTITLKTDTTANWQSSNRILALNEPALERTPSGYINMKLGDGVTPWNQLGYVLQLSHLEEMTDTCQLSYDTLMNNVDTINTLITNATLATDAANNAATTAMGVVENKTGINDAEASTTETYSSSKIESMFKSGIYRPHEWGVKFFQSDSGICEGHRLGDAIGMVANVGSDTVNAYNDFDYLLPWKSRRVNGSWNGKTFNVTAVEGEPNFAVDGSNGDVFAERHLFYYKYVFNNDKSYEIWISDEHLDGYSIPERFINSDGTVMDTYYYPCYKISIDSNTGNPRSISGADTQLNMNYQDYYDTVRTSLGNHYFVETTKDIQINLLLFAVEFATVHVTSIMQGCVRLPRSIQSRTEGTNQFITYASDAAEFVVGQRVCIGGQSANFNSVGDKLTITNINQGIITVQTNDGSDIVIPAESYMHSRPYLTGGTDTVKSPSGSPILGGRHQMRYRYVEDLWGNQESILGDILISSLQTYVCDDVTKFTRSTPINTDGYVAVSYTNCEDDGLYKQLGYDSNHPSVRMPVAVNVGSSQILYYGALYKCQNDSLVRVVRTGLSVSSNAIMDYGFNINCEGTVDGDADYDISARLSYAV